MVIIFNLFFSYYLSLTTFWKDYGVSRVQGQSRTGGGRQEKTEVGLERTISGKRNEVFFLMPAQNTMRYSTGQLSIRVTLGLRQQSIHTPHTEYPAECRETVERGESTPHSSFWIPLFCTREFTWLVTNQRNTIHQFSICHGLVCGFQIPCPGSFMIHPHWLDPQITVLPKTITTSQSEKMPEPQASG